MKYLRFYIYGFCLVFANSAVSMFLSPYLKSIDVGESEIGTILGVFHMMMPFVVLSMGLLSDRFSCRRLILMGTLISLIDCATKPFLKGSYIITTSVALGGIGLTLSFITANVLFLKIVHNE